MTLAVVEDMIPLFFTIIGLLLCLFKYVAYSKRRYLFLIAFFILRFLSDYYWMVYQLIMHDTPSLHNYVSNLGWDLGYAVLLYMIFRYQSPECRQFFHPLMLWPVLTNLPQLILYLPYDSLLTNLWEVGVTTLIMIFCTKSILYYAKNRKNGVPFPHLATLILLTHILEYGMWTSSCFEWGGELRSPYFYLNIAASLVVTFYAAAMEKDDGSGITVIGKKHETEHRTEVSVQATLSILIFGGCFAGYFIARRAWDSFPAIEDAENYSGALVLILFGISLVLVALILVLLHLFSKRYKAGTGHGRLADPIKRSRSNLIFTIAVVFVLMTAGLIYNARALYNASFIEVYEDGEDKIRMTATDIENDLTASRSTLLTVADTVGLMEKNGDDAAGINRYLRDQTQMQAAQFAEDFTGFYGCVKGTYVDGSGWEPPADYDPRFRDWYREAQQSPGEAVIVPPYVDAQTGNVVVTIAKCIPETETVICMDVSVDTIDEVIAHAKVTGKGLGMVVDKNGFIISHQDASYKGTNIADVYGADVMGKITQKGAGTLRLQVDDEDHSFFIYPVMGRWYALIVAEDEELFEKVNSELAVSIMVSLMIFFFISYFYYLGYKSERAGAQMIEDINMRMVTALASTIDAKDRYTSGHSQRVADYAVMIAKQMGKSKEDLSMIYSAALLHDVGKIRVPGDVINKPGRLEKEEFDAIRIHPVSGYDILMGIHEDERISYAAKYHHERYDGTGYPNRLDGENIPEVARIIAVADAYDAMASDRSYRKALPQSVIREEIVKGRGKQFDPEIADVMLSIIDADSNYELRQQEKKTDNILVIDDERMIIREVKRILEEMEGTCVLSATDDQEALAILESTPIALIMLDLKMPDIDGFSLYMRIRRDYDMPVILMTGDKSRETLDRIRDLGIDDYVTKPLNGSVTREAVYGLLHRTVMESDRFRDDREQETDT